MTVDQRLNPVTVRLPLTVNQGLFAPRPRDVTLTIGTDLCRDRISDVGDQALEAVPALAWKQRQKRMILRVKLLSIIIKLLCKALNC